MTKKLGYDWSTHAHTTNAGADDAIATDDHSTAATDDVVDDAADGATGAQPGQDDFVDAADS